MSLAYEPATVLREQIVRTRDGAVNARVLIGGDGPPVVFLHGREGLQWSRFHDGLAETRTVFAIEHVGSGQSTGLEEVYDFWDLVNHYEETLDQLGLPTTALIGHSFGGMVAAEMAAHVRRRITALVLMAPLGLWDDEHPVVEIDGIDRARRGEVLLADTTRPLPTLLDPDPTNYEAVFQAEMNAASINQFSWPIAEKGLARRLYRVTAPTLLVWGAEDRVVSPVYADYFEAKLRPNVDTDAQMIPGLGHLLHLEDPARVLPHVRSFLAERT